VTDESGQVVFTVPEEAYQLRIDYNSTQYWTEVINVLAFQNNQLELSLDEPGADLTNNPFPQRYDGEAPPYSPQLAAVGDLTGLLAQSTVQDVPSTEARTFYYISDHLGTSQFIVDSKGKVVWQGNYAPFGQVDVVINELENSFRFPGQLLDSESGLYYNWHRFYDPETGRYISADPIGLAGGMNLYAYVENDPINFVDPLGLKGWAVDAGGSYGTGWGDGKHSSTGMAGTGVYVGTYGDSTRAEIGGFSYQGSGDTAGADAGLGLTLTRYKIPAKDFFQGSLDYKKTTFLGGSLVKYYDECGNEVGWSFGLGGKGIGFSNSSGKVDGQQGALQ
jgi:RHS repeat-associated protein